MTRGCAWCFLMAMSLAGGCAPGLNNLSPTPNPAERMHELLNDSDVSGIIEEQWDRIWFTDEPSHIDPQRITGGIQ